MVSQLIARVLAVALFLVGLWCLAQAAIFSTSHQAATGGGVTSNIWSTTSSLTSGGSATQNLTLVSKWINGTNIPPGANAHVTFTLKSAVSVLLSGMYFGGSQTAASQCGGTLRVWNFAGAPIVILTQTTVGTGGFTTGQISIPSWPGTPFAVAYDTANGQNRPSFASPNSTNTNPSAGTAAFVSYSLGKGAAAGEAGTQCKSASYTTLADQILEVIGITSLP